jgi:hypothetical protein
MNLNRSERVGCICPLRLGVVSVVVISYPSPEQTPRGITSRVQLPVSRQLRPFACNLLGGCLHAFLLLAFFSCTWKVWHWRGWRFHAKFIEERFHVHRIENPLSTDAQRL